MRNGDKKESPAVNAMLRAADICEGYYADEVWTNTLARGAAFDLSRALRSEATKIAAEEYSSASSATEVDSRSRLRRIAAQKGEPAPDFSETSARDAALEEAAQECDAYVRACRDDEDSSAASDLAGHIRRRKGTPSSATLPNTEQSVALPAGHSRRGEGGTANAAIAPQVGSQGPAPFSFDKREPAYTAICGPSMLVKIDDGQSVHVRTAKEWLDLARRDFEAQRSTTAATDSEYRELIINLLDPARIKNGVDREKAAEAIGNLALKLERARLSATGPLLAKPYSEWHEDDGNVIWWRVPVNEPPWVGTPLDSDWTEGYYTHFTPLVIPANARSDGRSHD